MQQFWGILWEYALEIGPALALGFLLSGIIYEFVPADLVSRHLGSKGIRPILYSTLVGAVLPVCCWGSLPIAVSFRQKGACLGPVLAFLVAAPATSVSALLVSYSMLGPGFTVYIFAAVVLAGLLVGALGNILRGGGVEAGGRSNRGCGPSCSSGSSVTSARAIPIRVRSILKYAFVTLPREIGLEIVLGLMLATLVASFIPIGKLIRLHLGGWGGYVFSVVFGVLTYLCSTASVPLVDSLIKQGLNPGAAMTLLIIGPVTSYGTLLVLGKEYGGRVLAWFLAALVTIGLAFGLVFEWLRR